MHTAKGSSSDQVQEVLQYLHNNGCGQNDHSAIAKYYEKLAGILIGR